MGDLRQLMMRGAVRRGLRQLIGAGPGHSESIARASSFLCASVPRIRFCTAKQTLCTTSTALPEHLQQIQAELLNDDAALVDVREVHEWHQGHFEVAQLAPLSELQHGDDLLELDLDTKIYLHCAAGVRVHPAAGLIRELGYTDVHPLPEGFVELAQLGFGNVE